MTLIPLSSSPPTEATLLEEVSPSFHSRLALQLVPAPGHLSVPPHLLPSSQHVILHPAIEPKSSAKKQVPVFPIPTQLPPGEKNNALILLPHASQPLLPSPSPFRPGSTVSASFPAPVFPACHASDLGAVYFPHLIGSLQCSFCWKEDLVSS